MGVEKEGKFSAFDAFMLLACGILYVDSIASDASTGVQALVWWVIIGLLYMIPTGLIIGELSAALPGEGGVYVWVREGLGPKWAAMVSWFFFACGVFMPVASFVMFSDITFSLLLPETSLLVRMGVAVLLLWAMTAASLLPMAESKWITNAAGLIKILLFAAVFISGIVYVASGNSPANELSLRTMVPSFDQGLAFLPVILFGCTGMEIAAASAEEMDEPSKMLPRVVVCIAIVTIVLNLLANLGMLLVLPIGEIDLDHGLLDMFTVVFGSDRLTFVIAALFLFCVFAQTLSWAVGGNRGTCESAKAGDLPALFGKEVNGQPAGALLISCVVGTVLLLFYALFAESASALFFSLLSCGVIGSVFPYVLMIVAYQRLKHSRFLNGEKGFTAPCGMLLSSIAQIVQCFALMLMVYIPSIGWNSNALGNVASFAGMLLCGLVAINWNGLVRKRPLHEDAC